MFPRGVLMRWFGYGCFAFENDESRVVFDPHDGKSLGIFAPNTDADYVFCTHNTYARNCFRCIRGTHKDVLTSIGQVDVTGFSCTGIETVSIYDDHLNVAYRFTMDGVSVLVCGCLGEVPGEDALELMKGVDIVLVPIGEYATMSVEKVNSFLEMLDAPIVVPIEFKAGGITLPLSNLECFSEYRDPSTYTYMGAEIEFTKEDIEGYAGTWIFDF